jgi:type II secretory pathway predicted ATPase ExeA
MPSLEYDHAARAAPVLVIDEAHLLDHQQLESIRMLTNHDMTPPAPSPASWSSGPPCGDG